MGSLETPFTYLKFIMIVNFSPEIFQNFNKHLEAAQQKDRFVVQNKTQGKVKKAVQDAGFCPIFSLRNQPGKIEFTLVPYQIPYNFLEIESQKMVRIEIVDNKRCCKEIFEVLRKDIDQIQACGVYQDIPRSSNEQERLAAESSKVPTGRYRYAHAFDNPRPVEIKWLISTRVMMIAVPKLLVEQHGRRYYKWYETVQQDNWFCSKEHCFITMRPNSEDTLSEYWIGSIDQRIEFLMKEFIVKDIFGKMIDHWDCIKGGIVQPFRISFFQR